MSKLIAMRNRIKAIKTIKKITHAMRLISMSNQTRLKKQHVAMSKYVESLKTLFTSLHTATPEWNDPVFTPSKNGKKLLIIIGSQKGLCGSFNTNILKTIPAKTITANTDLIVVGKKVVMPLMQEFPEQCIYTAKTLNTRNMHAIIEKLLK